MKQFLDEDFLLESQTARTLYHDFAKDMPIFDYHNHLNPQEIYEDKKFENISQLWLGADHYKWRVLRSNGVTEDFITGEKSDYEKFLAFAKTIPYTIGNPLYHWTHLELQRYFNIHTPLSEKTAP
ncbi:MAG: glucuronate isomerase, partial [Spirochaetales bacterium]